MNDTQLAEQVLALRRLSGVPGDGPSVDEIHAWVQDAADSGDAIRDEVETILQGSGWTFGTTTLEYALAACDDVRSLLPIPMPDPNLVVHVNYRRRRLSVEHLGASPGAIIQIAVRFPPTPTAQGPLRDALFAALGHSDPQKRIAALLAVLGLSNAVAIQLSILDAATREARRIADDEQRSQALEAIGEAKLGVLYQSTDFIRYGMLTKTQRQGGVAYVSAESWLEAIGTVKQNTRQIGCFLVEPDHAWSLPALQASLDEIGEVDSSSAERWRDWLVESLPPSLRGYQDDLLRRLDMGNHGVDERGSQATGPRLIQPTLVHLENQIAVGNSAFSDTWLTNRFVSGKSTDDPLTRRIDWQGIRQAILGEQPSRFDL